jgi:four helix bundle protein
VISNVAEGFARKSDRDFARFLDMARGSCSEVQSLLYVALDVGHISQQQFDQLYESADVTAGLIGRLTISLRPQNGATHTNSDASADSGI